MKKPVSPIAIELLTRELAYQAKEQRESIVLRLHSAFLHLTEALQPLREMWQGSGAAAYQAAAECGWNPLQAKWLRAKRSVFNAELWGSVADTMRQGAQPGDETQSAEADEWVWWKGRLGGLPAITGIKLLPGTLPDAPHDFSHGAFGGGVTFAARLQEHRAAIFGLPALIANGDRQGIDDFLERVLPAMRPKLAREVLASHNRRMIDQLLAEQDSMLTWLAYMEMVFESVPPSLYAHLAGPGGATLMLELRLMLPLALLCSGPVIGHAIHEVANHLECFVEDEEDPSPLDAAVAEFAHLLVDFVRAANEVHELEELLSEARIEELDFPFVPRSDLRTRKAAIRRDKSCRACGSLEHRGHGVRMGTVAYE
ncbi:MULTISPECIES: hypothetical protein [unclassified Duganella]|uniref:hypothetical protein n=1 Tax=unclassified Duganella TaxID=2636909 RepID=UPI00070074E7|nr:MULTISPECIES: hypothetical protein [unclassified Duganella]KQV44773.1 hypothetical protein ASD07_19665 [Duganella sp. Root336D2]KRB83294.1 hypothetical protein ASE26_12505 [Duganella sp. Root198D2]